MHIPCEAVQSVAPAVHFAINALAAKEAFHAFIEARHGPLRSFPEFLQQGLPHWHAATTLISIIPGSEAIMTAQRHLEETRLTQREKLGGVSSAPEQAPGNQSVSNTCNCHNVMNIWNGVCKTRPCVSSIFHARNVRVRYHVRCHKRRVDMQSVMKES